jgi:broad specificity phosphatase PhoE
VVTYLTGLSEDTAVFSHFVAINAALGAAIGDDRVVCFRPAHASITVLETKGRAISLVELGETAETTVR